MQSNKLIDEKRPQLIYVVRMS